MTTAQSAEKIASEGVKTILVVEDDVALNRIIVHKLKEKGLMPISVADAQKALEVIDSGTFIDYIWLDILLPGMDGISFLRIIREKEGYKDKKVFVISASGGFAQQEEAERLGVVDYIVKGNYSLDDIVSRVLKDINASAPLAGNV